MGHATENETCDLIGERQVVHLTCKMLVNGKNSILLTSS